MTAPGTDTDAGRVLVVDDDPDIQTILGERLELEGYRVEVVGTAEDALASYLENLAHGNPFKVLTLDIMMEPLGGPDLLRIIRLLDQEVTILMVSGTDELSDAVQALRQGADEYLSKPIKIWDIRDRVTTAIGRRRSLASRTSRSEQHGLTWGSSFAPTLDEETEDSVTRPEPATRPAEADTEGEEVSPGSASPLDALFFVARRLEAARGLPGHGDLVARLVTRLGALLAGKLGLRPPELEALRLAARLHGLGFVRESGRLYWTAEEAEKDDPDPARPQIARTDEPELVRGILEAIGRRAFPLDRELLACTVEVLGSAEAARKRASAQAGPEKSVVLGSLFEVADLWQHLLVDLDPEEALRELERELAGQDATGTIRAAIDALTGLEKLGS